MKAKTVLFGIISIVGVPSLFLNIDTHFNHDDEVELFTLSVKLQLKIFLPIDLHLLDERSRCHCDFWRSELPAEWFSNTKIIS